MPIIDNPDGETETERIAFAQHMMEESRITCMRLTADLRESLNSVSLCLLLSTFHNPIYMYTHTEIHTYIGRTQLTTLTPYTALSTPLH